MLVLGAMHRISSVSPIALVSALLLANACSASSDSAPASAPGATTTPPVTTAPTPPAPTPRAIPAGYAEALADTITEVDGRTGLGPDLKVDITKLQASALALLQTGGKDVDAGFNLGIKAILDAYPVGHLAIMPADTSKCGTPDLPYATTTVVGACTQPFADHAVVTIAAATNPLGLVAGDEIIGIDDKTNQAMLDAAIDRPMCTGGVPSASARRARAATSVFAGVVVGTKVMIQHLSGLTETKTVSKVSAPSSCGDPFSRGGYVAKASTRADGVGVLHIPSFEPASFDTNDPQGTIDKFEAAIKVEFDKVKSAPYLVIDVRGNGGGSTEAALAIVAGMPGARTTEIAKCQSRVPHKTTYTNDFTYTVEPSSDQFGYTGKVAILLDGNCFSATDYFARAMRMATNAILVGRPEAGAYGGTTDQFKIDKGPGVEIYPDPWRCTDADGKLLEGQTAKLDAEVDLAPPDLTQGRDTDLETAVTLLKK